METLTVSETIVMSVMMIFMIVLSIVESKEMKKKGK